jgi:hypothetical protein
MGSQSFSITLPRSDLSLGEALVRAPRAFREQAQKGFKLLAGIEKEHYGEIIDSVMRTLENKQPPEELGKSLSLSTDEMSGLLAAAMLIVPLLANRGTPEEFGSEATKVGFLPTDVAQAVVPFARSVFERRVELRRIMRRAALPSQVLPFLADVEIVVDVRMDFEDQEVYEAVPVALFHIDTDTGNTEIWFQASKSQMEQFRKDIDAAIRRMEIAEAWTRRGRAP